MGVKGYGILWVMNSGENLSALESFCIFDTREWTEYYSRIKNASGDDQVKAILREEGVVMRQREVVLGDYLNQKIENTLRLIPWFDSKEYSIGAMLAYRVIRLSAEYQEKPLKMVYDEDVAYFEEQNKLVMSERGDNGFFRYMHEENMRLVLCLCNKIVNSRKRTLSRSMDWGIFDTAKLIAIANLAGE